MGIFLKSPAVTPALSEALESAMKADPASIRDIPGEARNRAQQLSQKTAKVPARGRIVATVVVFLAVLGAFVYAATLGPEQADLYNSLKGWITPLLTLVGGVLGGEFMHRRG